VGQVATVGSIVNTGDPFDANITERTNGIGGGCATAGSGWCRNRYAQQGATQVMTDASPGEDPFAWLRAGARRVGETAVWGRGVGSWGETDGEAFIPGSEYSLGGAIVGVDHIFTPTLLAGTAVQWTTTDVEFGAASGDAEVDSIEVGLYGSIGDARLYANANVSYIWHDFEVNRVVGPSRATGDYDGETISAYLEAGKTFETDGGLRIQPLVALSYAHLETDDYSETGTGTLLNVLEADLDSLKSIVGARAAYPFEIDSGRRLVTEIRAAWTHEFMDDHSAHFSDVQGGAFNPVLVTGEEFSRDSVVVGAGVTAPIADNTTVFVDYDAGLNADITTHTISAGLRVRW
jgi:subtilase-type serine protease